MWNHALALAVLCTLSAAAGAQVQDITPRSEAQQLGCLQRPDTPPKFPEHGKYDEGSGFMRVLLRFSKPDEAPGVEVLANTARRDMQDEALRYVSRMRLPCLTPEDGTVQAVQEFAFKNSPMAPLPVDPRRNSDNYCIVVPRDDLPSMNWSPDHPEHVVVAMVFDGDGTQPPTAKLIHSDAGKRFERVVLQRAATYRMPCRKAGDKPIVLRQLFTLAATDKNRYVMTRKLFDLPSFLALTEGIKDADVDFNFDGMGCPFKLNYTILGPSLPNEVSVGGKPDLNRIAFVRWIRDRQIAFRDAVMRNDLFGSTLQIDIPCGILSLHPDAPKAG